MADFLNTVFAGYDRLILTVLHFFGKYLGFILTPLTKIITFLGEKGIFFFALAVVLACFKKTRKVAVCLFGSVCCGALITNIILKDWVARPRPFDALALYREWWITVGSPAEKGFSFPSGHVTSATAGMFALYFSNGKKYLKSAVIVMLVMAFTRNYLMVHYPSDVLFSAAIGFGSAYIAWVITKLIFRLLEEYEDTKFCDFCLNFDLDISKLPIPEIRLPFVKRKKGKHEL